MLLSISNEEGILLISIWLVTSLLMIVTIDILSVTLKRTGWSRFSGVFLLFYSQIIVTEFILGLFTSLDSYSLLIFNILVSVSILTYIYKSFGIMPFKEYFSRLPSPRHVVLNVLGRDWQYAALLLLSIGLVVWIIFLGILFPVIDFDGNSYHLTFLANIIQNHTFFDTPTSLSWLNGYPKGGEFIQMWSLLPLRSDVLVDLSQIPFIILAIYSLYYTAVNIGAKKNAARFSALIFLFIPVVLNQLKTTYVDVMLCALFFSSLAMAVHIIKQKYKTLDLVLLGIVLSLILSIKSTGLLFIFAVAPLIAWGLFKSPKLIRGNKLLFYLKAVAAITIPMLFGLYWYIKNIIIYGSPIYPFGFKISGHSIFPGKTFQEFAANATSSSVVLPHNCTDRIWFVWTEQKDWFGCLYNYDSNYTGLGPLWFIILLPSIVLGVYFALRYRRYLFLSISLLTTLLFSIYPTNYYSRYTIFITAIGIFALAICISCINKVSGNIIKLFIIILAASTIVTNITLCNFSTSTIRSQTQSMSSNSPRGAIYSVNIGKAFVFMENVIKPGEVVVYGSKPYFIYPLWRTDYSNRVIYIHSTNQTSWYNDVRKNKVKYIFVSTISKEVRWAHNLELKNIYKDSAYEIYKVY